MKTKDIKPHIGIYGKRNTGKSTLINALCGQDVAIVSEVPGTTTDPVKKSVEIFGIGPAVIVDTAGVDDEGTLGEMRINKSKESIKTIDLAILLIAGNNFSDDEVNLIKEFKRFEIPYVIVHNKTDIEKIKKELRDKIKSEYNIEIVETSGENKQGIDKLINTMKKQMPENVFQKPSLFEGIVLPKDIVLLVTPIDSEAPDGRMILPQVMAIRDVLDKNAICILVRETELSDFLEKKIKPALVVTDSQAFDFVNEVLPENIPLTSFSIVFSRLKGDFENYLKGTSTIDKLQNGDKVLILESCTHQVSCEDIGRHKLPRWIKEYTNKEINFEVVAGLSQITGKPEDYKLVIQCGGCVATRKQILSRLQVFTEAGVPVTNYGMAIAYINGIFNKVTGMFK